MEIKIIEDKNKYRKDIALIQSTSFNLPFEKSFAEVDFLLDGNVMIGTIIDEKLVSCSLIFTYNMFYNRESLKMGGIGAVATLPEYRLRGYSVKTMKACLEKMKNEKQIFSLLVPFSYEFYRKQGWELGICKKQFIFDIEGLKFFCNKDGRVHTVSMRDLPDIQKVYNNFIINYNGAVDRSDKQWLYKISQLPENDCNCYIYRDFEGICQGYIFYSINSSRVEIWELVYLRQDALEGLLQHVYALKEKVSKVDLTCPEDNDFILQLDNPAVDIKVYPYCMVRVVDVMEVLKLYPYNGTGNIIIDIKDTMAPWNNGIFKIEVNCQSVKVSKDENHIPDIAVNINTISQVLFGYANLEQVVIKRKLNVINEAKINDLCRLMNWKCYSCIFDSF